MLWFCLHSCAAPNAQIDSRAPPGFAFPASVKGPGVGSVNAAAKCTPGLQAHRGSGSSPSCPGLLTYQLAHATLLPNAVCTLVVDAHLASLAAQPVLCVCPCEMHRQRLDQTKSIVSIHLNKWPERTDGVSCSKANIDCIFLPCLLLKMHIQTPIFFTASSS